MSPAKRSTPSGPGLPDLEIEAHAGTAPQETPLDRIARLQDQEDIDLELILENLRLYQSELELQNSELRAAQEQAQSANTLYRTLFAHSPLPILVMHRRGVILEMNAAAEAVFAPPTQWQHQPFLFRLVDPSCAPDLSHALVQATDHGHSLAHRLLFRPNPDRSFYGDLHLLHLSEAPYAHPTGYIGIVIDLSERQQWEDELRARNERLQESEARYRILADFSPDWEYWLGPQGRYEYVSPACANVCGHSAEAFLQDPELMTRLIHTEDQPRWIAHWIEATSDTEQTEHTHDTLELRLQHPDGDIRWIEHHCRGVYDADGQYQGRRGVNRDITARKHAEAQLRQTARAFESTADGIVITDTHATIVSVNRSFIRITGYTEAEIVGRNARHLRSRRHRPAFYRTLWTHLQETGQWGGEIWARRRNGEEYPGWMTIAAVTDPQDRVTHYVGVFTDISRLKRSEERLDYLAHHDLLTALPNRGQLLTRLKQALDRARRRNHRLAVLFVDMDRFKHVNDSLGHAVGDDLLRAIANRMTEKLRAGDTLARVGGDEFVVLLQDDDPQGRAADLAEDLLEQCRQPHVLPNRELFITASIGISLHPRDGTDPDNLLKHADLAMHQSKSQGRNTYQFYHTAMAADADERLHMENALRGALHRDEFFLHYQPQIHLEDRTLAGAEVLLRWQNPQLGLVSPALFIPIAEEMGVIADIGAWVLTEACAQMRAWDDQGLRLPRLAVNLSTQQLERGDLVAHVEHVLNTTGLAAKRLELEVTESMIMRQAERSIDTLNALRALGAQLAVDDFGTGYSSLGYIQRLPLHRLKIDRSFVRDIGHCRDDEAIVRAIIGLGQSLGLEVIAEGVERAEQADFLRREGCQIGQGYRFGHPVTAASFTAAWASHPATPPSTVQPT